jgi:hypothetical protein
MGFKLILQKNKNRNSYLDRWAEGVVLFFPLKLANPPKWRKLNRIGNLNWELGAKKPVLLDTPLRIILLIHSSPNDCFPIKTISNEFIFSLETLRYCQIKLNKFILVTGNQKKLKFYTLLPNID